MQFPNQNGGALKLTVCYAKLKHLPLQHYSCSASHWSTALAIFDQVLAWLCHLVGWRYTHLSSGQLHHSGRWMYGEVNSASKPFRVMTNYPPQDSHFTHQNHQNIVIHAVRQGTSRFNLWAKSTSLHEAHTLGFWICGFPVLGLRCWWGLMNMDYSRLAIPGGFNPVETYSSKWIQMRIFPKEVSNEQCVTTFKIFT